MSTTGTFHIPTPRAVAGTGRASQFAVAAALSVTAVLVAFVLRPMTDMRASERDGGAALMNAGAVTQFGPIRSHLGRLRGDVVSHPALVSGTNQTWTVRLTTPAGTGVDGSPVTVEAYMPETGERMQPAPTARYVGDGQYKIEGLRFSRTGWWNVGLAVRFAFAGDSLAFNVILAR